MHFHSVATAAESMEELIQREIINKAAECNKAVKSTPPSCTPGKDRYEPRVEDMVVRRADPNSLRGASVMTFADDYGRHQKVSLLNPAQATRAFEILKSHNYKWSVPILCASQAQLGSMALEREGVTAGKIFVTRPPLMQAAAISARTEQGKLRNDNWKFHVAQFVKVDNSGKLEDWVLDPTLFKGPVPVETWKQRFDNDMFGLRFRYASRYSYLPGNIGDQRSTWKPADVQSANEAIRTSGSTMRAYEGR